MKKFLLALLIMLCLAPTVAHAAAYNLNLAPIDNKQRYFHRTVKWTATGGVDTLEAGATFDHFRAWLTAGSSATFDGALIPWAPANPLIQSSVLYGTAAPPAASQTKAGWGVYLVSDVMMTYAVTDVMEFKQSSPIWRGVYLQATVGTVINLCFDRMDPSAVIR